MTELTLIALAWLGYGALHSWLASARLKHWLARRWPALMPGYRLAYNGLASALLLPPLFLTWRHEGAALWHWPTWLAWPAAIAALAGFLWSLRWYDGLDFIGLRQWRSRRPDGTDHEKLSLSPLHRHVRHPWYSLGLLLLWTRDLNAAWLVAALAVTAYIVVGSRLEERKLVDLYGDAYRRYQARVPGLVPMPGRSLSAAEAAELARQASRER